MPPIRIPEELKKYGKFLGHGLIAEMAPEIVKGALVEMLKERKTDVRKASDWVENNASLWDSLAPAQKKGLVRLGENVHNLDWLDAGFVIQAIKDDFPALASLFLGWRKGKNWLGRQVEIIKAKAME